MKHWLQFVFLLLAVFSAPAITRQTEPVIGGFRGNILGVVTNSVVVWNPARPTGYGAVPDYRPLALGSGASISLSSAWRGHWADITGYHSIGATTYDPVSGRWLSFDAAWNGSDVNGMSFAGGDPVNYFDPDGRMSRNDYQNSQGQSASDSGFSILGVNFYFTDNGYSVDGGGLNYEFTPWNTSNNNLYQDDLDALASAGRSLVNTTLNTSQRSYAWNQLSNPDFSSGWGMATWGMAGVSYTANTLDAGINMIPVVGAGKAVVENTITAVAENVTKSLAEDVAKTSNSTSRRRAILWSSSGLVTSQR
jgi:RHS repeat-associated protein